MIVYPERPMYPPRVIISQAQGKNMLMVAFPFPTSQFAVLRNVPLLPSNANW